MHAFVAPPAPPAAVRVWRAPASHAHVVPAGATTALPRCAWRKSAIPVAAAVAAAWGFAGGLSSGPRASRRRCANSKVSSSRALAPALRRGVAVSASASPTVDAPPKRKQREAPTPFPEDELFHPAMKRLMEILAQDRPREHELEDALYDLQDVHGSDMQWAIWPKTIDEARTSTYARGCFRLLRGIVRVIAQGRGPCRSAAVSLLLSLMVGGANLTQVPAVLAVQCGAVSALCRAAREGEDTTVLGVIRHIAVNAPTQMIATVIDGGAIEAAIAVVHRETAAPMDQLTALDLILSFAKRAPAKTVQVGTYDAIKVVTNEAIVPRRNKILNLLRPVVEHNGSSQEATTTNIRIGGLKF
mmetsp:Transcript_108591/g.306141  ORF Transcript_108591/g.306141 Transcript_108591/m.306141 type:complete len:358 (-) Transcript_108591:76-1149(-)